MSISSYRSGLVTALALTLFCLGALPPSAHATFPGRPGVIVFNLTTSYEQGRSRTGGLFSIRPGDKQPRQLTANPWDNHPSFAPSGKRLVFRRVNANPSGLFLLNLARGTTSALTTRASDLDPAFGRRGMIAFARFARSSYDLFLRTPGGRIRRLTKTSLATEEGPVFSPDGKRIIFVRSYLRATVRRANGSAAPQQAGIYSIRTDGTGLRLLGSIASDLDTSPDGRSLAFETSKPRGVGLPGTLLWTRWLRSGVNHFVAAPAGGPTYSPAGDRIAYWNYQGIWTVGTGGLGPTQVYKAEYAPLENSGALAIHPAWQPLP